MNAPAREIIACLGLQPHPEGGHYREVFRSQLAVPHPLVAAEDGAARSAKTAIYYLLEAGDFSAFHAVRSDETWHLYAGGPVELFVLKPDGERRDIVLGLNFGRGQEPQATVPARAYQAARLAPGAEYALCGCTVAPGFDFADFDMTPREELQSLFPEHEDLIAFLTR